MKKTALVIMAAGIGSRFGKGIKQLAKVGPSGEIIMDYSIHDALEAGFNKIVFIIRKDIEEEFREVIGNRIEKTAEVEYVFPRTCTTFPKALPVRKSAQSRGEPVRRSWQLRMCSLSRSLLSTQMITTAKKPM